MFCKQIDGVFYVFASGTINDLVYLSRPLNEKMLRSHLKREIGHGEGRAMFSLDDAFQDCFVSWFRAPYLSTEPRYAGRRMNPLLKTEFALAHNWKQKTMRDLGKDLSFKTALCDRPAIGADREDSPQAIHCGDDKPLSAKAQEAENEAKKEKPKYTAQASPTMQENARRFSGRILPKLGGQLLVDAKIDLGEDFTLLDLIRQGYTQTEIAERLNVSQGTVSNRSKKLAKYFKDEENCPICKEESAQIYDGSIQDSETARINAKIESFKENERRKWQVR